MLFNSYIFILAFLPIVLIAYYILLHRGNYASVLCVLIAGSLLFYGYNNWRYVFLLIGSVLGNWLCAKLILREQEKVIHSISDQDESKPNGGKSVSEEGNADFQKAGKAVMVLGIALNLALLFVFKYYDFFIESCNALFRSSWNYLYLALPLGISFYTFQQISFLVDTYRGETKDYRFLEYAAFVSFFPQLVAGPIVMHGELIPQFRSKWAARDVGKAEELKSLTSRFGTKSLETAQESDREQCSVDAKSDRGLLDVDMFAQGIYSFSMGLGKKVLLADTFSRAVTWGYDRMNVASGEVNLLAPEAFLVALFYTLQIYFDFSAYSDMAIGIGKMFGFTLPINFHSPYKAVSIVDFWKRWHMTLTRFLRTYVYIPLGGNRKGTLRKYVNILIVFLLSGLWHGANWTFVVWGFLHGCLQVFESATERVWKYVPKVLRVVLTFLTVNLLWVLFRAQSLAQGVAIWKSIFTFSQWRESISSELTEVFRFPLVDTLAYWINSYKVHQLVNFMQRYAMQIWLILALGIVFFLPNLQERASKLSGKKAVLAALVFVVSILYLGQITEFLYFNF